MGSKLALSSFGHWALLGRPLQIQCSHPWKLKYGEIIVLRPWLELHRNSRSATCGLFCACLHHSPLVMCPHDLKNCAPFLSLQSSEGDFEGLDAVDCKVSVVVSRKCVLLLARSHSLLNACCCVGSQATFASQPFASSLVADRVLVLLDVPLFPSPIEFESLQCMCFLPSPDTLTPAQLQDIKPSSSGRKKSTDEYFIDEDRLLEKHRRKPVPKKRTSFREIISASVFRHSVCCWVVPWK